MPPPTCRWSNQTRESTPDQQEMRDLYGVIAALAVGATSTSSGALLSSADDTKPWELRVATSTSSTPRIDEAYNTIIRNQYPSSCAGRRFALLTNWDKGVGSSLHMAAEALGVALSLNRYATGRLALVPLHTTRTAHTNSSGLQCGAPLPTDGAGRPHFAKLSLGGGVSSKRSPTAHSP